MSTVITLKDLNFNVNISEAMRYIGAAGGNDTLQNLVQDAVNNFKKIATPLGCYIRLPIKVTNDTVDFGFAITKSKSLAKNLKACNYAFIFAVTLGVRVDLALNRSLLTSPSEAVILDAVGSAAVEGLANSLNDLLENQAGQSLRPRFSPGYGDFDLSFQRQIITLLDTHRKIGLSLTDGLMLTPTKSITAIVGIPNQEI